ERHAGLERTAQVDAGRFDLAFECRGGRGAGGGGVRLDEVDEQGKRRRDDAFVLQAGLDACVIDVRGMEDIVEAGQGRIACRVARARMDAAQLAQAVGFVGDDLQLFEREGRGTQRIGGDQVVVGARDLDGVDFVLDLQAYGL